MNTIRNCLDELGIEQLNDREESSCMLAILELPPKKTYAVLHDELKSSGFIIYAGQGKFSSEVFRISPMGDISEADISRLICALKRALT